MLATQLSFSLMGSQMLLIPKQKGDLVVGGSVNGSGVVWTSVHAVGKDTLLAKITKLVAEAQMRKPAVQAQADRVASYFVPVVVIIAIITFVSWMCAISMGLVSQAMVEIAGVRLLM